MPGASVAVVVTAPMPAFNIRPLGHEPLCDTDAFVPAPSMTAAAPLMLSLAATFATGVDATPAVAVPIQLQIDGARSLLAQDANSASPTFGQFFPQAEVSGP